MRWNTFDDGDDCWYTGNWCGVSPFLPHATALAWLDMTVAGWLKVDSKSGNQSGSLLETYKRVGTRFTTGMMVGTLEIGAAYLLSTTRNRLGVVGHESRRLVKS